MLKIGYAPGKFGKFVFRFWAISVQTITLPESRLPWT
jgi:hypothetical protein